MARSSTDKPSPRRQSAENRWYEASIAALTLEGRKHTAEATLYREQAKSEAYSRMLHETDARARRVYDFTEAVERESAAELIAELSDWVAQSDDPILVRLNTPGGDEIAGLAIVDFIRAQPVQIDTLGIGEVASMGSVLLQAGDTRYLTPHALLLIHESRTFGEDAPILEKLSDMKDRLWLGEILERASNELLAERSIFEDVDQLVAKYGSRDWWMTAADAVAYGFADAIWRGDPR